MEGYRAECEPEEVGDRQRLWAHLPRGARAGGPVRCCPGSFFFGPASETDAIGNGCEQGADYEISTSIVMRAKVFPCAGAARDQRGCGAARARVRVQSVRGEDETCPVSTGEGTKRVQSVREGGGEGADLHAALREREGERGACCEVESS